MKRVSITQATLQDLESIRKRYLHKSLNRSQIEDVLKQMGFPITNKTWPLYFDYKIVSRYGKTNKTYYLVSSEPYALSTLLRLAEKINRKKSRQPSKPRNELTVQKCLNFLEERGYLCIKMSSKMLGFIKSEISGQRQ